MSIYQEKGYEDREDYLKGLALELEIDYEMVLMLAELLGPEEDFDGLVTQLEDYAGEW